MENKLKEIVNSSGLEKSKAKFILESFNHYFEIADEWAKKCETIKVTDASQKDAMDLARTGRLFLKEKRIAIEEARKELKEQPFREGKAIDGIANVLKALIAPLEEYLDKQEHFVEIKQKEAQDKKRMEIESRMEAERIAEEKEKADKEKKEREAVKLENEKLKKQLAEKEKELKAKVEVDKSTKCPEKEKVVSAEMQRDCEQMPRIKCPHCHEEFNWDERI